MMLNLLLALHVVFGAVWFGLAVSFRVRDAGPHKGFLTLQTTAAVLSIGLGFAIAAIERPDMASRFGQTLMIGAAMAVAAALLLASLVVWPTLAAARAASPVPAGARRRMILAERLVALLLLTTLTLMTLAHRI